MKTTWLIVLTILIGSGPTFGSCPIQIDSLGSFLTSSNSYRSFLTMANDDHAVFSNDTCQMRVETAIRKFENFNSCSQYQELGRYVKGEFTALGNECAYALGESGARFNAARAKLQQTLSRLRCPEGGGPQQSGPGSGETSSLGKGVPAPPINPLPGNSLTSPNNTAEIAKQDSLKRQQLLRGAESRMISPDSLDENQLNQLIKGKPNASSDSTAPPIGTVVDSGMLYKSNGGLKVAYSSVYLGTDPCGSKYKVTVSTNNNESTNVNVTGSIIDIDSDYDGFEQRAGDCKEGLSERIGFGSSTGYERWTVLSKGFADSNSRVVYMKSTTKFPHLSANIVPRADSTSKNVNQTNTGVNADHVAQSTGTPVKGGTLYSSRGGLSVTYSIFYLGTDSCGRKFRVMVSISNSETSNVNVAGSIVDLDDDYDRWEQKYSECSKDERIGFGVSPGFQSWKMLDPNFSDSNSRIIYMKSNTALPNISANIVARPQ